MVDSVGFIAPGTAVLFPLDTIDGESVLLSGRVESCAMIAAREHQAFVRFGQPIQAEDFVVCWGLAVGDDGYCDGPASSPAVGVEPQAEPDAAARRLAELGERLTRAAREGDSREFVRAIVEQIAEAAAEFEARSVNDGGSPTARGGDP
jgi:hypothetical protein